jgi:hypothetical protein
METVFNFNNYDNRSFELDKNIILRLQQTNHSIACLWFMDQDGNKLPIPQLFTIYTIDYNSPDVYMRVDAIDNMYTLHYSDDYEIYYKGEHVLSLLYQKSWTIRGSLTMKTA